MNEYNRDDFKELRFNPYDLPMDRRLQDEFPIFKQYETFTCRLPTGLQRNKVLRYIIYTYDPASPLVAINNPLERRIEGAVLAGFEAANNSFGDLVDSMIKNIIPEVNQMIIQFCILMNEDDYAVLITYQELLRKQLVDMLSADATDAKTLISNAGVLRSEIKNLKQSILSGNSDHYLNTSFMEFQEAELLMLNPEYFSTLTGNWDNISRYYKVKDEEPEPEPEPEQDDEDENTEQ